VSDAKPRSPRDRSEVRRRWVLAFLVGAFTIVIPVGVFGLQQRRSSGIPGACLPNITCTRVLFIGDSLTFVNDLPATFADLAWAGRHRVDTRTLASSGETLAGHLADSTTAPTIRSEHWNTVVLQDQSENPALVSYRLNEMYPAATQLVAMIRKDDAQPLLFLTWAHQTGWPQADLTDYATMQAAVDQGYLGLAADLDIPIAPIGDAWQTVVSGKTNADLWQSDGVHPSLAGTYLAACVFYATIFQQSPVGLSYRGGLSDSEAADLQQAAASTVLSDPTEWGLSPQRP